MYFELAPACRFIRNASLQTADEAPLTEGEWLKFAAALVDAGAYHSPHARRLCECREAIDARVNAAEHPAEKAGPSDFVKAATGARR